MIVLSRQFDYNGFDIKKENVLFCNILTKKKV